jgi:hypothetical protein
MRTCPKKLRTPEYEPASRFSHGNFLDKLGAGLPFQEFECARTTESFGGNDPLMCSIPGDIWRRMYLDARGLLRYVRKRGKILKNIHADKIELLSPLMALNGIWRPFHSPPLTLPSIHPLKLKLRKVASHTYPNILA